MARKTSQSILNWLLWQPLKFALISLILTMLFTVILATFNSNYGLPMTLAVLIAMICAAILTLYKLPNKNMTQRGFVALNNVQMITAATAFIISAYFIATYQNEITTKLIIFSTLKSTLFTGIIIMAGLFYMYLCGLFVTNLYVKYIRCREMGISPWKIICSMPFGFGLLWTGGYLIADDKKSDSSVVIRTKWYSKFTNWIVSSPAYTTLLFCIITIYSGFFYGFKSVTLTLILAIISALWFRMAGRAKFNQQKNGIFAYFAIVINIAIIITLSIWYSNTIANIGNIAVNISDIAPTSI